MRSFTVALATLAAFAGTVATAQVATPKLGTMVMSADGKRIGRIDRVLTDNAGQAQSVAVIYDARFVKVPVSTLTAGEAGRVVSTLSRKEISAIR